MHEYECQIHNKFIKILVYGNRIHNVHHVRACMHDNSSQKTVIVNDIGWSL